MVSPRIDSDQEVQLVLGSLQEDLILLRREVASIRLLMTRLGMSQATLDMILKSLSETK